MKLTATVLGDGKDGRVLSDGIELLRSEGSREAVENSVINMKDVSGLSELGGVPVIMGGENRRFGVRMNPKDEGPGRVRSRRDGMR